MLTLEYSTQFKKDFKKVTKMPIPDIVEVCSVITTLQKGQTLPKKYLDHSLSGNWVGFSDCHVKPDLVLIYRVYDNYLQLSRIGSHSELF
jgi:mRNA interferase YafQ